MLKRILSIAIAVIILTAGAAGCKKTDSGSSSTTATTTTAATTSTKQTSAEPVKLTVLMGENSYMKGTRTEEMIFEHIKKKTGVILDVVLVPSDERDTKRDLALASGEYYDFFKVEYEEIIPFTNDGHIASLSPYLEKYGPNFLDPAILDPQLLENSTFDGEVLCMPVARASSIYRTNSVRQDWLDKLNIDPPETIEEFEVYLESVLTTDMNGDGINSNEIPLIIEQNAGLEALETHFLVHGGNDWIDENGNYNIPILDPNYTLMLEKIIEWYKKGYVWIESFTSSRNQVIETLNSMLVGAIAGSYSTRGYPMWDMIADNPDFYYSLIAPKGPGLNKYISSNRISDAYVMSTKTKYPEKVVEFFNWHISPEGWPTLVYGVKGVHWEFTDDSKQYFDLIGVENNDPSKLEYVYGYQMVNSQLNPFVQFPRLRTLDPVSKSWDDTISQGDEMLEKVVKFNDFPYDQSSWDSYQRLGDMQTWLDENRSKILIGQLDISQWNSIVERWRSLGGYTYLNDMLKPEFLKKLTHTYFTSRFNAQN